MSTEKAALHWHKPVLVVLLTMPCCYMTVFLLVWQCVDAPVSDSIDFSPWADWWTYDGISGPSYWGLNPAWTLCRNGKFQSPIDIKPRSLLYDPSLSVLNLQMKKITGNLTNTGHDVTIHVVNDFIHLLNASMGPLQYKYHIYQIKIHFGRTPERGSEHTVDGEQFPAEIQIFSYNRDLYKNASQAMMSPKGIAIFAIFAIYGYPDNEAFRLISERIDDVHRKGNMVSMNGIPIDMLFPDTKHYVTYEGSFTQPGCQESVTWIVFNRPIRIKTEQLAKYRNLKQGGEKNPDLLLEGNYRPIKPLNNRVVRTNINLLSPSDTCSMRIQRYYGGNVSTSSVTKIASCQNCFGSCIYQRKL